MVFVVPQLSIWSPCRVHTTVVETTTTTMYKFNQQQTTQRQKRQLLPIVKCNKLIQKSLAHIKISYIHNICIYNLGPNVKQRLKLQLDIFSGLNLFKGNCIYIYYIYSTVPLKNLFNILLYSMYSLKIQLSRVYICRKKRKFISTVPLISVNQCRIYSNPLLKVQ